jgi:hypothetical protein
LSQVPIVFVVYFVTLIPFYQKASAEISLSMNWAVLFVGIIVWTVGHILCYRFDAAQSQINEDEFWEMADPDDIDGR